MITIDGYHDLEPIGRGGLGDVYRATRTSTGATVAVKVLRDVSDESVAWHRTRRELTALVMLAGHANVITVFELSDTEQGPALVMEYAPGGSVGDMLEQRGGPLTVAEAVLIGRHTAAALSAAHAHHIVHRDVKPHNLLIDGYGQVKLCDFGIASMARSDEFRTRTDALSMRYASPEDLDEDAVVGPPSDVYSLGATLLHLARGAPPSFKARLAPWTAPSTDDVAAATLDQVISACLHPDPARRPDADDVLDRLEHLDRTIEARCRSLVTTPTRPDGIDHALQRTTHGPGPGAPDPSQAAAGSERHGDTAGNDHTFDDDGPDRSDDIDGANPTVARHLGAEHDDVIRTGPRTDHLDHVEPDSADGTEGTDCGAPSGVGDEAEQVPRRSPVPSPGRNVRESDDGVEHHDHHANQRFDRVDRARSDAAWDLRFDPTTTRHLGPDLGRDPGPVRIAHRPGDAAVRRDPHHDSTPFSWIDERPRPIPADRRSAPGEDETVQRAGRRPPEQPVAAVAGRRPWTWIATGVTVAVAMAVVTAELWRHGDGPSPSAATDIVPSTTPVTVAALPDEADAATATRTEAASTAASAATARLHQAIAEPALVAIVDRPVGSTDLALATWPFGGDGECLTLPNGADHLEATSCSDPLDLQRITADELDDTFAETDAPFEAHDVQVAVVAACEQRFAEFVHLDLADSNLSMPITHPSAGSWAEGDRAYQCLVGVPGRRLVGDAAGSGR
ncbi:MAG: serine/threonine-protein kinase [Ilumatobacteraceae bacterium]